MTKVRLNESRPARQKLFERDLSFLQRSNRLISRIFCDPSHIAENKFNFIETDHLRRDDHARNKQSGVKWQRCGQSMRPCVFWRKKAWFARSAFPALQSIRCIPR